MKREHVVACLENCGWAKVGVDFGEIEGINFETYRHASEPDISVRLYEHSFEVSRRIWTTPLAAIIRVLYMKLEDITGFATGRFEDGLVGFRFDVNAL